MVQQVAETRSGKSSGWSLARFSASTSTIFQGRHILHPENFRYRKRSRPFAPDEISLKRFAKRFTFSQTSLTQVSLFILFVVKS